MFKEWAFPVFASTHHVLIHGLSFPDLHFHLACFLLTEFSLFDPEISAMLLSTLIFDAILLAIALKTHLANSPTPLNLKIAV
jgi:hypothetical protein